MAYSTATEARLYSTLLADTTRIPDATLDSHTAAVKGPYIDGPLRRDYNPTDFGDGASTEPTIKQLSALAACANALEAYYSATGNDAAEVTKAWTRYNELLTRIQSGEIVLAIARRTDFADGSSMTASDTNQVLDGERITPSFGYGEETGDTSDLDTMWP